MRRVSCILYRAPCDQGQERDNVRREQEYSLSDRKYRQHGYQDSGEKGRQTGERPGDKPARKDTFGPRPLQMAAKRTVSRCSQCGTVLASTGEIPDKCPKCGFELHSCKQCMYFDPSSRFECMQAVPERVSRKDVKNQCTFYSDPGHDGERDHHASGRQTHERTAGVR